ncbi:MULTISPECIES: hypothetical protein [Enterobacter]|jgi:hypothetical protein|uniref:hypothetical protein n=1 Tax=Enterobacter TaxID=547 RepID=UPI000D39B6FA|nr:MULTISPECIES: hypothetical protein [Enterobacter]EKX7627290.1 hypothetical protein [Enterobacter mori]EME8858408.1 hypothetical protein [Enterobacter mori]MBA7753591.1 hypothetical protein [Enterobacter sp. RHBSTW-01064]MCO7363173.1 hypothetical protein [Enterobacter mori]NTZ39505.1 hypothetical protein [Enterobacter sp. JMULE2]
MNNLQYAIAYTGIIAMLLCIISAILGRVNRKYYKEICALYKEKYGKLPWMTQIYDNINSLYVKSAYGFRMDFIFRPLIWNKKSSSSQNDDKDFIRGLPLRLRKPFYIEYGITVTAFSFMVVLGILVLIDKYI